MIIVLSQGSRATLGGNAIKCLKFWHTAHKSQPISSPWCPLQWMFLQDDVQSSTILVWTGSHSQMQPQSTTHPSRSTCYWDGSDSKGYEFYFVDKTYQDSLGCCYLGKIPQLKSYERSFLKPELKPNVQPSFVQRTYHDMSATHQPSQAEHAICWWTAWEIHIFCLSSAPAKSPRPNTHAWVVFVTAYQVWQKISHWSISSYNPESKDWSTRAVHAWEC